MKKYSLVAISTILLVMSICLTPAKAADGVSMPAVTSNLYYDHLITLLKDDPAQTNALVSEKGVIDLLTGNFVKEFPDDGYDDIAVNEEASYYALLYWNKLVIYNQFGEIIEEIRELNDEEIFYNNSLEGFIPETNSLLIYSKGQLVGYDVDSQKVIFTRTLNNYDKIRTSSQYIAVSSDNNINLYNPSGVYLDTLELDSSIRDFTFSPEQQLIVSTDDPQLTILEVNRNFERKTLTASQFKPGQTPLDQIKVDDKGKYLIGTSQEEGFRIFNYSTGQRIHTSIDGTEPGYSWNGNRDIAITPNGKYILVNDSLYNGKNLTKYVTAITVPEKYQTIELGSKIKPMVKVTRADGVREDITSGVTWRLNNSNAAYINNTTNLLMTKKTGSATLKASYLSFEYVMDVKVVDTKPPKLSGIKDKTIYVGTKFNARTGVKATDVGEGNLTSKIKVSGSVNAKKAGTYKLKYTVTDTSGNKTSQTRKITVKKNKK